MPTAAPPAKEKLHEAPKPDQTITRSLSIDGFERVRKDESEDSPSSFEFKLSSDAPVEIWRDEFETPWP